MKKYFALCNKNSACLGATLAVLLIFTSCGKQSATQSAGKAQRATPITVAKAQTQTLELREESVGRIESRNSPTISAEVAGKVKRVLAENGAKVKVDDLLATLDDADIKLRVSAIKSDLNRLKTLTANQERNLKRLRPLARKNVISENQIDDAEAQLKAMREQLDGAQAQLSSAERDLAKTEVRSPVSGRVENRMISVGDFMTPGKPMFMISNEDKYQAHLPFPETVSGKLRVGETVTLSLPVDPGKEYAGVVNEIRPVINAGSKAIDVIVYQDNPGGWKSGASITGKVLVDTHKDAVVVPAICVVLRPAGEVIYAIEGNIARQRVVKTGVRLNDVIEITEGLKAGESVAQDGAAYLSDGATVKISGK